MTPSDILLKKLEVHSKLDRADRAAIRRLQCQFRELSAGEDLIRQGDRTRSSAVVISGMCARYHTLPSGNRQYLSLHIAGDWPDAQGLFLDQMDHSVCAIGRASVCTLLHTELLSAFRERPTVGFAVWRETLIDAAIYREAITNNSSRHGATRLAHLFAEIYYRSRAMGLIESKRCYLPLTQTQIGEMLGMSIATVSRHLHALRARKAAEWKSGELVVENWDRLADLGDFDPLYLHRRLGVLGHHSG